MTPPKTALVSPEKSPFDVDEALKTIVAYEGFRPGAYADTKGLQTIGYGTLIGDGSEEDYQKSPYFNKPISEKEALKIARRDLLTRLPRVVSLVGGRFFNMAPETQREIVASFYRGGITGSPKTLKLIRAGKFKENALSRSI
jgi:GH24 family phage-related lysozyme (muramidase)